VDLEAILPRVSKPARYTGGEWNSVVKDWEVQAVRIALAYPDVYDIGMSNLGLAILYDILNRQPDVAAERVYAPWLDMEAEMRAAGLPLFSLETRHPLTQFDVIGFSLSCELTYSNVLNMLDLAGLPVLACERDESSPLVIAGGSGALNPEPMSDFIDVFALGDGEELVLDLVQVLREWKREGGGPRRELLRRLARMQGFYVPSFYAVAYNDDGTVREIRPGEPEAPARPRKRFLSAKGGLPPTPTRPIVPFLQTVHDRAAIEIQRGCTQGCRFCQAGMIYRPRLERAPEEVVETARELLANTGYDELSLVSLSTTDHSRILPMVQALRRELGDRLKLSLPSLRVDSFSVEIADAVPGPGKHSITFAPETGSQRLRDAINKLVTDDDALRAVEAAFAHGWTSIKMYFMVGLPTETLEDVQGIVELARQVKEMGRRHHGGRARVRVSTSNFIPKPHTPFQWARQMAAEELRPRHELLRSQLKRIGVAFSWEDPEQSVLEAVLSCGDRRLGRAIHRAWQLGAKFDAWSDSYDWSRWQQALEESGLSPAFYAHREKGLFEVLPWSHIDVGITAAYLRGEWLKTQQGKTTGDCAPHKGLCNVCGVQNLGAEACLAQIADLIEMKRGQRPGGRPQTGPVQARPGAPAAASPPTSQDKGAQ
jgi:radical SAM family uncharacterized protein